MMFLNLSTQWNCSQGAYIGLNYQSVSFLFDLYKVKKKKDLLEGIQIMEREALTILNARE